MMMLEDGKVDVKITDGISSFDYTDNAKFADSGVNASLTPMDGDLFNVTATIRTDYDGNQKLYSTISNIINLLGVHEFEMHGMKKVDNSVLSHEKVIFKAMREHESWSKTTVEYKNEMIGKYGK